MASQQQQPAADLAGKQSQDGGAEKYDPGDQRDYDRPEPACAFSNNASAARIIMMESATQTMKA